MLLGRVSNAPWKAKYSTVNEEYVVSVASEFDTVWCKIQHNLVKSSEKISKSFVLLVQYHLVKDTNLHNFSNLSRMKEKVVGSDTV